MTLKEKKLNRKCTRVEISKGKKLSLEKKTNETDERVNISPYQTQTQKWRWTASQILEISKR